MEDAEGERTGYETKEEKSMKYRLLIGDLLDSRSYPDVISARKAAYKRIHQEVNVTAIIPETGSYQYLYVKKIRMGTYKVVIEYWSRAEKKFVQGLLDENGKITKSKWR